MELTSSALVADFDEAPLAALTKGDGAGTGREDCVVAADARTWARAELRPTLTDENHPGLDLLAGEDLHAEHLRVRIATVARRAKSFFVSHLVLLLLRCESGL